ncbi:hypothetical protein GCM10009716_10890 [Streptomyces sodiiphilus]|uniref:Uncharacterized protein n=1 Tax=Streptomyces sodiiphilus TaxID=226217 RepID=A0ABN2NVZ5_9ACTN
MRKARPLQELLNQPRLADPSTPPEEHGATASSAAATRGHRRQQIPEGSELGSPSHKSVHDRTTFWKDAIMQVSLRQVSWVQVSHVYWGVRLRRRAALALGQTLASVLRPASPEARWSSGAVLDLNGAFCPRN